MNSSVQSLPIEPNESQIEKKERAKESSGATRLEHAHLHMRQQMSISGQQTSDLNNNQNQAHSLDIGGQQTASNPLLGQIWQPRDQQVQPLLSSAAYSSNQPSGHYVNWMSARDANQPGNTRDVNYLASPSDQLMNQNPAPVENPIDRNVEPDADQTQDQQAEQEPEADAANDSESRDSRDEPSDSEEKTSDEQEQNKDTDEQETPDDGGDDNDLGETDSGQLEPVNSELIESSGERNFDEDQSDSNERDRDGLVVKRTHRHLLNGKPVKNRRELSREKEKLARAADFDKIVTDIEASDRRTRAKANKRKTNREKVTESGRRDTPDNEAQAATPSERSENPEGDERLKFDDNREFSVKRKAKSPVLVGESSGKIHTKPKDLHEHQLHETLTAQQWDDDALSDKEPSKAEDETHAIDGRKDNQANADDDGTSTVDFAYLDLLTSNEFPFMNSKSNEIKRQKRQLEPFGRTHNETETRNRLSSNLIAPNATDLVETNDNMRVQVLAEPGKRTEVVQIPNGLLASSSPIAMSPADMRLNLSSSQPAGVPGNYALFGPQSYVYPNRSAGERQANHLASASKTKKTKKKSKSKKNKKIKKSKMTESKYEGAKANALKRKRKFKKGSAMARKSKKKKNVAHSHKVFEGNTKGKKGAKGAAQRGSNKGNLYYKDKGYKKRGFKKAYQKVESGNHKTYFDEFRDKDQRKKWKKFKDGHHYSQKKHWAGKDKKMRKNYELDSMKDKNSKSGIWKEKEAMKFKKEFKHKSKKGKKYSANSSAEMKKKKKEKAHKSN